MLHPSKSDPASSRAARVRRDIHSAPTPSPVSARLRASLPRFDEAFTGASARARIRRPAPAPSRSSVALPVSVPAPLSAEDAAHVARLALLSFDPGTEGETLAVEPPSFDPPSVLSPRDRTHARFLAFHTAMTPLALVSSLFLASLERRGRSGLPPAFRSLDPASRRAVAFAAAREIYLAGRLTAGRPGTEVLQSALDAVPGPVVQTMLSEPPRPWRLVPDGAGPGAHVTALDGTSSAWPHPVLGVHLVGSPLPASSRHPDSLLLGWLVPWDGELALLALAAPLGRSRAILERLFARRRGLLLADPSNPLPLPLLIAILAAGAGEPPSPAPFPGTGPGRPAAAPASRPQALPRRPGRRDDEVTGPLVPPPLPAEASLRR